MAPGLERVFIATVKGTRAQREAIRAAAARLTAGNVAAFVLIAAVEKAERAE